MSTINPKPDSHGSQQKKLVTISVPVLNEEPNIDRLIGALKEFAKNKSEYDFEFLFTDNASSDRTFDLLCEAAKEDARIRVIRFSRNFGFQTSILANFLEARGDAVIQLDADLQDPPHVMGEFLEFWEDGYKVVYGVRRKRKENAVLNWTRRLYYTVIGLISDISIPQNAGDFRLIDRIIVEHLREVRDNNLYLRGIIAGMGYPQIGVVYDRSARVAGSSKFRLGALMRLAMDGVCSQSTKPLQVITTFGFFLSGFAVLAAIFYLSIWLVFDTSEWPAGFLTLVILIVGSVGINAAFMGVIGEYVGRIYSNSRDIPAPIVEYRIESDRSRES